MTKDYSSYLAHHGVKGQKWGVRRYQNEDGTLKNSKGKKASGDSEQSEQDSERRKATAKKIIGAAAVVAIAGLAAYGAYKGSGKLKNTMKDMANSKANSALWEYAQSDVLSRNLRSEAILDNEAWKKGGSEELAERRSSVNGLTTRYRKDAESARQSMLENNRASEKAREIANESYGKYEKYQSVKNTATRTKAVKNWIKNKGRINVDNL